MVQESPTTSRRWATEQVMSANDVLSPRDIDLPLKGLVWADGEQTKLSYYTPHSLAARHHLDPALARRLAGIDQLTDALVAQLPATGRRDNHDRGPTCTVAGAPLAKRARASELSRRCFPTLTVSGESALMAG
jgi:hypothetical protein